MSDKKTKRTLLVIGLVGILLISFWYWNQRIDYKDSYSYWFRISANDTVSYSILLPAPSGWVFINDVESSEGNAVLTINTINHSHPQYPNSSFNQTLNFINITGSGIQEFKFKWSDRKIDGVGFPMVYPERNMDAYIDTEPDDEELGVQFYFSYSTNHIGPDPPRVGHFESIEINGQSTGDGWQKFRYKEAMS